MRRKTDRFEDSASRRLRFASVSVATLAIHVLLNRSKEIPNGLETGYGATAGRKWTLLLIVPILSHVK
jgi:hypothetical protein